MTRTDHIMNWREHLNPAETARLDSINMERAELHAERRRIYDRCRKRAKREERLGK